MKGSDRAGFLSDCTVTPTAPAPAPPAPTPAPPPAAAAPAPAGAAGSALTPTRDFARDSLRKLLAAEGPGIGATFEPGTKTEYNFSASITDGLKNAESLVVIIRVSANATIDLTIYPRYKGSFVTIDRVANKEGLMRYLLIANYSDFLYWGIGSDSDVFAGFTITLESGFPYEALVEVLRNIKGLDRAVGSMRLFIDGSAAVR